jgi:hypothetical protein
MSEIYTLSNNDLVKGVAVAILSAVLTWLLDALQVPTFDFASLSFLEGVRIGLVAGIAYLVKNFATDGEGKILGKI